MARLSIPGRDDAPQSAKLLLDEVATKLGSVPNVFRLIANSPAALAGYAGLSGALSKTLDIKLRARIALAVAEINGCAYCLATHSYLALNVAKLGPDEISLNRQGRSANAKANAAIGFARKVAELRGHVSDTDLTSVRAAGFDDAQIVDIVACVAENMLTNMINNVAQTSADFPLIATSVAS